MKLDKLKKDFIEFKNKYPESELNAISAYRVIRKFVDSDKIEEAIKSADELKDVSHPYAFIYSLNKLISEKSKTELFKENDLPYIISTGRLNKRKKISIDVYENLHKRRVTSNINNNDGIIKLNKISDGEFTEGLRNYLKY